MLSCAFGRTFSHTCEHRAGAALNDNVPFTRRLRPINNFLQLLARCFRERGHECCACCHLTLLKILNIAVRQRRLHVRPEPSCLRCHLLVAPALLSKGPASPSISNKSHRCIDGLQVNKQSAWKGWCATDIRFQQKDPEGIVLNRSRCNKGVVFNRHGFNRKATPRERERERRAKREIPTWV